MESVSLTQEQRTAAMKGGIAHPHFIHLRSSLAPLLDFPDEGKDWKALAWQLGLSHMIGGLQATTSPTMELLYLYKVGNSSGFIKISCNCFRF